MGPSLMDENYPPSGFKIRELKKNLGQYQETIYRYFLSIVKKESPEQVLKEFKQLFIAHLEVSNKAVNQALFNLVFANQEEEFTHTLKRCCYILINNWEASRHHEAVQDLVNSFEDQTIGRPSHSAPIKRLRKWTLNFVKSSDYEEIKLFCAKFGVEEKNWSNRYTSYLLVPQYINIKNSAEQRQAAKVRSHELKEKFKFDLAMYTTRSQLTHNQDSELPQNPTQLGDEVLHLIKTILLRRGPYNYLNLAHIFLQQTQDISYQEFKQALQRYLVFSVDDTAFIHLIENKLSVQLNNLYTDYDDLPVNKALLLRTCNRVVEYLTTEDRKTPSNLFVLWVAQNNPLTLVTMMLKLILISKPTRVHLEARIADLIHYYKDYPENECKWLINFMEVLNIAFAIYADNVQYNLVRIDQKSLGSQSASNLDKYQIFSQLHMDKPVDFLHENHEDFLEEEE
ncbi:hypothetical protein PJF56_12085 [Roseofilum sp. BLCC_M91]|uniref:Uncharacterized protein n=1 Tax=Roseofilum halophilum BLCC-M91 TaxID=3022259 RepID=A0ABT7BKA0_9CYAN|nr:hypothetical protein [Roseofilum halophilum]MDJ1179604.1 hypothetical protein [Roseofilum halophilum BLCC-M91]